MEKNTSCSNITNGTVYFCGTEQQTIKYLTGKANIEVLNPAGVKYLTDLNVYRNYQLNGNPLERGTYTTNCYTGSKLDSVSDYQTVKIMESYILDHDLNADMTAYSTTSQVSVPEGSSVTLFGKLLLSSGTLRNDGKLHITDELKGTGSCKIFMNLEGAELWLQSNFNMEKNTSCSNITNGSVIFNGSALQNVKNLKAATIILENESEEGVVFTTAVTSTVLFDHRQNAFTLYNNGSGSSFVDYDGDGLKDNVDPWPTVGNPCVITVQTEDEEKGEVLEDVIDTVGGTKVTVHAEPAFKYWFSAWVDGSKKIVSTSAVYTFVARGDTTLTALFTKRTQPISTETSGGFITAPASAEIESLVTVSVTEEDGYVFQEGSISCNGVPIDGFCFEMPDEPVVLTAVFTRNEAYFALLEAIEAAEAVDYVPYSAESYAALLDAISEARDALINHITDQESEAQIAALQAAAEALQPRIATSLTIQSVPVLYVGLADSIQDMTVLVTYDNGWSEPAAGWTVENFDCAVPGQQEILISCQGVTAAQTVTVQLRPLSLVSAEPIPDQLFLGDGTAFEPTPVLTFDLTGETLVPGDDVELTYWENVNTGLGHITVEGVGNYTGVLELTFTIYCRHQAQSLESVLPTCTETGLGEGSLCAICGETLEPQSVIPALGHNYVNGICTRCGQEDPDFADLIGFDDVPVGAYYADAVLWAVQAGITAGTSETTFSPNSSCTRAQFVTFLWRAEGRPEPASWENPFRDVYSSRYYYEPVLWAVGEGITSGTSATAFSPNKVCKRAEAVTFLWRFLGRPEAPTTENPFTDVHETDYFYEAVLWAYANGYTSGTSETTFSPEKTCTRAQAVTFLYAPAEP